MGNEVIDAALLASYVPIDGTVETKIQALHERIMAGGIAPDQLATLKATAERDAAQLVAGRFGNANRVAVPQGGGGLAWPGSDGLKHDELSPQVRAGVKPRTRLP